MRDEIGTPPELLRAGLAHADIQPTCGNQEVNGPIHGRQADAPRPYVADDVLVHLPNGDECVRGLEVLLNDFALASRAVRFQECSRHLSLDDGPARQATVVAGGADGAACEVDEERDRGDVGADGDAAAESEQDAPDTRDQGEHDAQHR